MDVCVIGNLSEPAWWSVKAQVSWLEGRIIVLFHTMFKHNHFDEYLFCC